MSAVSLLAVFGRVVAGTKPIDERADVFVFLVRALGMERGSGWPPPAGS